MSTDDIALMEYLGPPFAVKHVARLIARARHDAEALAELRETQTEFADQDVEACHQALTAAGVDAGSLSERVDDIIGEYERERAEVVAAQEQLLALELDVSKRSATCLSAICRRRRGRTPDNSSRASERARPRRATARSSPAGANARPSLRRRRAGVDLDPRPVR
jgi:hypothetical protein